MAEKETYAIVELMGHVRLAGRLTEEEKFGSKMGRLDIPTSTPCTCASDPEAANPTYDRCSICGGKGIIDGFITQHFGGGSVYRITYVSEAVARQVAKQTSPAPVSPWDFPKQIPAPAEEAYVRPSHPDLDFGSDLEDRDFDDDEPHER